MWSVFDSSAGPEQEQLVTSYPETPIYTNLRAPRERQDKPLHQRCLHSFCSSSQNKRRNKRWQEHLFKQSSKAVFHLFSPFFCSRLGLRSEPPTTTPPKPCSTDSSGSIHRRDLWSLIAGKWTRGRGFPRGEAFCIIFYKSHKEKDLKRGKRRKAGGEDGLSQKHCQ